MALDEAAKMKTKKQYMEQKNVRRGGKARIFFGRGVSIEGASHTQSSGEPVLSEAVHLLLVIQLHVQLVVQTVTAVTAEDAD